MHSCENLPEQLLVRWNELYPENELNKLFIALSKRPLPSFRTNTLKTTSKIVEELLTKQGFILQRIDWYQDAFILKNKSVRELTETEEYRQGFFYIQNLSSMIPSLVLDPQQDEKILDISAAPGSKATHIAMLMQNSGELTANDLSFKRLFKLKDTIKAMGVTNAKVLNLPGESFWKKLPEYFDRTLVDVPCSMEGRIQCSDPKTFQDWSSKKIKQLSKLQKYLLRSAISATKVGGIVVYSTCTLAPEENEEVIEWVMDKTNGAVTVEKIHFPNLPLEAGIEKWKNKQFKHTVNCARIFPNEIMEGFFIAKMKKVSSTLPK